MTDLEKLIENIVHKATKRSAYVRELDIIVNGPLVEIANIMGQPIYARFRPEDDVETIKHKVGYLREIIKDVVVPND